MTRNPLTLTVEDSLDAALEVMDDNDIRHVPVVEGETLVGVISDRDLLSATGWLPEAKRPAGGPRSVRELLGRQPVVASPDDSVVMAAVDLTSRGIGSLPVVEKGELIGILTERDLLGVYCEMCTQEGGLTGLHQPIDELMVEDPVSVAPAATLADALALAEQKGIRHLPVLDGERLVGILSDRDLRRARGRGLELDTAVSELMTPEPVTLTPGDSLLDAVRRVLDEHISALPIAEGGALVGILTVTDLLDHCIPNLRTPDH